MVSAPVSYTDGSPITYIDGGCNTPVSYTDGSPVLSDDLHSTSHHTVGAEVHIHNVALRCENKKIENTYCVPSFEKKNVEKTYCVSSSHTAPQSTHYPSVLIEIPKLAKTP